MVNKNFYNAYSKNSLKKMNKTNGFLPMIKNNFVVDEDTVIEEDEVVLCYNLTVKSGVTLTVKGTLIDLAKRSIK